ncbi:hypothetical protein H1C71_019922, partial [Ictidomys tridecemlineatus]
VTPDVTGLCVVAAGLPVAAEPGKGGAAAGRSVRGRTASCGDYEDHDSDVTGTRPRSRRFCLFFGLQQRRPSASSFSAVLPAGLGTAATRSTQGRERPRPGLHVKEERACHRPAPDSLRAPPVP